jgi:hypothetical protein
VKLPALLIVSLSVGGGCFRDSFFPANSEADFPGRPPPVPAGSPLEEDIAAGYSRYYAVLGTLGQWRADDLYGEEWCPAGVDPSKFVPYRSKGHWAAGEDPTDPPHWESEEHAAAWEEITTHHGWWVYDDRHERQGMPPRWCWVPGNESTPARVLWRVGGGFVAWAPEPPPTDPDDEGDNEDLLDWDFEFIGSLYDDSIDNALLSGEASETADALTHRGEEERHRQRRNRVGPSRSEVVGARQALAGYVAAHPEVSGNGRVAATPKVSPHPETGAGSTPSGMSLYAHLSKGPHPPSEGVPRIPSGGFHSSRTEPYGGSLGHSSFASSAGSTGSGHSFSGSSGRSGSAASSGSSFSGGGSSSHSSFGHGSSSSSSHSSGDGGCGGHSSAAGPPHTGGRR